MNIPYRLFSSLVNTIAHSFRIHLSVDFLEKSSRNIQIVPVTSRKRKGRKILHQREFEVLPTTRVLLQLILPPFTNVTFKKLSLVMYTFANNNIQYLGFIDIHYSIVCDKIEFSNSVTLKYYILRHKSRVQSLLSTLKCVAVFD